MSKPFIQRITRIHLMPEGEPIFSEMATSISIDDESTGEYLSVTQHHAGEDNNILINPDEWPALRDGIDFMIKQIVEGGAK